MAKAPVFYLGTHMDGWLAHVGVPLFVSHRRLARRKTLPKARSGWALGSGGYSELSLYGGWRTTPEEYVCRFSKFVAKSHINWRMVANSPHQGEIVGSAQYPTGVKHISQCHGRRRSLRCASVAKQTSFESLESLCQSRWYGLR